MQSANTNQPTIENWIEALRASASLAGETPDQHQRIGPAGFLRHMGIKGTDGDQRAGIDESLWFAAIDDSITAEAIDSHLDPDGPVHQQAGTQAIELWTERELGALHALCRLAQLRDCPRWHERALDAARWHLKNTQPDNATNHPWAIQVFLDCWQRDPESDEGLDARLYAETLLHNCMTTSAQPDPLSALILRDAADGLSMLIGSG